VGKSSLLALPPLSLYVHLPWCVRKCPYCDFNSHELRGDLLQQEYVDALLRDLELELPLIWGRPVHSIFFGGGTPSLFSAGQIGRLLQGVRRLLALTPDVEVTLEANPGTTERDSFSAYRAAGVNRISLGVQSFHDDSLRRLGRIHGRGEIFTALESIHRAGIGNFNLDLMYALPGQSLEDSLADVETAISFGPAHISHYQLTIEPNTVFHAHRPPLPDDELAWDMQDLCAGRLDSAGYRQYEISAWSKTGQQCRHNLNYWSYGDFVGIGAGAHGKITLPAENGIRRRIRARHPKSWMAGAGTGEALASDALLNPQERVFEFFLNQLRLRDGVHKKQFGPRTGLPWSEVAGRVASLIDRGLLEEQAERLVPTETGWRFVNDLQSVFLPPGS
jgi:oxygen-independent coproporphyrinogen-3 oxidase